MCFKRVYPLQGGLVMQQNNKLQALLLAGALGRGDICTPTKKKREQEWKETTLRTLLIWMQVFHSQTVQKRSRAKWLCLSGKIYCTLGQNGHDGARWLLWNKNSSQKKKKRFISITLNDSGQHNLSWLEIDVQSGILSVGPFFGKKHHQELVQSSLGTTGVSSTPSPISTTGQE